MNMLKRLGVCVFCALRISFAIAIGLITYDAIEQTLWVRETNALIIRNQIIRLERVVAESLRAQVEGEKRRQVLTNYMQAFKDSLPAGENYPLGKQTAEWDGYTIEVVVGTTNTSFQVLGLVSEQNSNL